VDTPAVPRAATLLFLCGFPSSGTDLLKNLLNAHPDIRIGGEFPLLPSLARRFGSVVSREAAPQLVRALLDSDIYGNLKNRDLPPSFGFPALTSDVYRALLGFHDVAWTGNKTPQNSENIDKLELLFPGSRYVLIVRDIRDVALSWRNKWGKDPYVCAHKWNDRMKRAIELLQAVAPDRHMIVHYEALLDDHPTVGRAICSFLQIEYSDRMSSYDRYVEEHVPGKLNYGKPVIRQNTGKWRDAFPDFRVERIESIAFDRMKHFGYVPRYASHSKPITGWELVRGNCQDSWAMLTVGNRAYGDQQPRMSLGRVIRRELLKRVGRYRNARS
jgi:hypothetical protein